MRSGQLPVDEALIAADAVLDVHDVVTRRETPQIFEEGSSGVGRSRALTATMNARAKDFFLGDEHEPLRKVGEVLDCGRKPQLVERRLGLFQPWAEPLAGAHAHR